MQNMTLSDMVGRTMISISQVKQGTERIDFLSHDAICFSFYHEQVCCESVYVEDICGDLSDLLCSPLLLAEEVSNNSPITTDPFTGMPCDADDLTSLTWTFYKFSTIKGSVTIRWLGTSNGYYSEHVDFKASKIPGI